MKNQHMHNVQGKCRAYFKIFGNLSITARIQRRPSKIRANLSVIGISPACFTENHGTFSGSVRRGVVFIKTWIMFGIFIWSCSNSNSILSPKSNQPSIDLIEEITVDESCTCARKKSGKIYCWGACTMEGDASPQIFHVLDDSSITKIHATTWGLYLIRKRSLWNKEYLGSCKGKNCSDIPIDLNIYGVQNIAGHAHHCFIINEYVYCNGPNSDGQVGVQPSKYVNDLQAISIGHSIDIDCGTMHSCAISSNKDLYCWGDGKRGQIRENLEQSHIPILIDKNVQDVATSDSSTCYIFFNGKVRCLGEINKMNSTRLSSKEEVVELSNVELTFPEKQVSIFAGNHHYCSISILGRVFCWGRNISGAVFPDVDYLVTNPVLVKLPKRTSSLALGYRHSCALLETGEIYCWGGSGNGEMGFYEQNPVFPKIINIP